MASLVRCRPAGAPSEPTGPHSSRGPGHRPLKAEITGSNPVCGTTSRSPHRLGAGPARRRPAPAPDFRGSTVLGGEVSNHGPRSYGNRYQVTPKSSVKVPLSPSCWKLSPNGPIRTRPQPPLRKSTAKEEPSIVPRPVATKWLEGEPSAAHELA